MGADVSYEEASALTNQVVATRNDKTTELEKSPMTKTTIEIARKKYQV